MKWMVAHARRSHRSQRSNTGPGREPADRCAAACKHCQARRSGDTRVCRLELKPSSDDDIGARGHKSGSRRAPTVHASTWDVASSGSGPLPAVHARSQRNHASRGKHVLECREGVASRFPDLQGGCSNRIVLPQSEGHTSNYLVFLGRDHQIWSEPCLDRRNLQLQAFCHRAYWQIACEGHRSISQGIVDSGTITSKERTS